MWKVMSILHEIDLRARLQSVVWRLLRQLTNV